MNNIYQLLFSMSRELYTFTLTDIELLLEPKKTMIVPLCSKMDEVSLKSDKSFSAILSSFFHSFIFLIHKST